MSEKPLQLEEKREQPKFERPPIPVFGPTDSLFPEEEKQKVSEDLRERFSDGELTDLPESLISEIKDLEYEKKSYEIDFIEASNRIISQIRQKYGLPAFEVPAKNIHIIPPELFKKLTNEPFVAMHDFRRQIITANAGKFRFHDNRLPRAATTFHEMEHLTGFLSLDIEQKGGTTNKKSYRRLGLMMSEGYRKSKKDEWYESFRGLNEAVVSELEYKYEKEIAQSSSDPATQEELQWLESEEAIKFKAKIGEDNETPVEEIEWVSKDGKNWINKSYRPQRRALKYIVSQISEDTGKSIEDIYDLFFKAHFTGNIREIADLIDSTFGPGQFRVIGMMTGDNQSANQMLDHLRKQRIRIKKHEKDQD